MGIRELFKLPGEPNPPNAAEGVFDGAPDQAPRPREFPITGTPEKPGKLAMAGAEVEVETSDRPPRRTSPDGLVERIVKDGYLRELRHQMRRAA